MRKTGERWMVKDKTQLHFLVTWLQERIDEGKTTTLVRLEADRSSDQNSMFYALYSEIATQKGDETLINVKADCKLRYGVVIKKSADPEWAAMYDRHIKPLSFEAKILLMQEYPITSKFTKKQATQYIDTILQEYHKMGYALADPRTSGNR